MRQSTRTPNQLIRLASRFGIAIALVLGACNAKEEAPEAPAEAPQEAAAGTIALSAEALTQGGIKTAAATEATVSEILSLPGNLQPQSDSLVLVNIHAGGEVAVLAAQVGDDVRAGQQLAVITSLELAQVQAEYRDSIAAEHQAVAMLARQQALSRIAQAQAQARLEVSRRQLKRAEALFNDGIVSRQDYEAARATYRQNELSLSEAEVLSRDAQVGVLKAELAKARQTKASKAERIRLLGGSLSARDGSIPVLSPIKGRVASREITRGQAVEPNAPLFKIVDANKLVAILDAPEGQTQSIVVGRHVDFTVDAIAGRKFEGVVTAVGDVVDPETRKIPVRCKVKNPEGVLKPGMFVTAKLALANKSRLVVPEAAVQMLDNKPVVFVSQGEGRFERRAIVTGTREGGRVAVTSGLKTGEKVVTAGAFWIKSEFQKGELEE